MNTDTIAPTPTAEIVSPETQEAVNALLAKVDAPPVQDAVEVAPPVSETVSAPIAEIISAPAESVSAEVPAPAPIAETTPTPAQVAATPPAATPAPAAPVIEARKVSVEILFPNKEEFTKRDIEVINETNYVGASELINMLVSTGQVEKVRKQPQAGRGKPTDIFRLTPKAPIAKNKKNNKK